MFCGMNEYEWEFYPLNILVAVHSNPMTFSNGTGPE